MHRICILYQNSIVKHAYMYIMHIHYIMDFSVQD